MKFTIIFVYFNIFNTQIRKNLIYQFLFEQRPSRNSPKYGILAFNFHSKLKNESQFNFKTSSFFNSLHENEVVCIIINKHVSYIFELLIRNLVVYLIKVDVW